MTRYLVAVVGAVQLSLWSAVVFFIPIDTVSAGQPPTVAITAPATNSQFTFLNPISFQAVASDPEGGALQTIAWRSSQSGNTIIGWGSPMTTSSLSVGDHVITASTTDSENLVGQASISITVNPRPVTYCDARGGNSTYEWIQSVSVGGYTNTSNNNGGYGDFTTAAPIPMVIGANGVNLSPGGGYSENWTIWIDLNRDGRFDGNEQLLAISGTGLISSTLTIPSSAPKGKTRMRIVMSYGVAAPECGTFSYGEVEDYVVDIGAGQSQLPTAYCASKGNSTSYEWINQIALAGITRTTGANGGYGNYTAQAPIALVRGANAMSLTPGFTAMYIEHWRVWVDYNQDGIFADTESVYAGASQAPINTSIVVPTTAKSGTTRMRVTMRYGTTPTACETFSFGEVEDHNVSIP